MTGQVSTTSAEAGQRGSGVRGDCWIQITRKPSGGIDIKLQSKVQALYGDATRQLISQELIAFGITHATLEIEDSGALPFVIMARVEAAARRLGVDVGLGCLPEFAEGTQASTQRDRFRRSRLYLPGNEPKYMLNAGLHRPDAIILDLEDSVAPSEKDTARLLVRNALRALSFHGAERMVRINPGTIGMDDLEQIVPHRVHLVLVPKVESIEQIQAVDQCISEIQKANGIQSDVLLMPIVETALGMIRAYDIASASPNIVALAIGLEDYTADIGVERTQEGRESFWARSQVVNAARAAGVQPIDTVFSDVGDMEGLRQSVLEAKSLGFDGKGCIHPRQIPVVHDAFAPTAQELERARCIVEAFEQAQAKGLAAVSLGSKMIDPPVVKRAQRIVQLAESTIDRT